MYHFLTKLLKLDVSNSANNAIEPTEFNEVEFKTNAQSSIKRTPRLTR